MRRDRTSAHSTETNALYYAPALDSEWTAAETLRGAETRATLLLDVGIDVCAPAALTLLAPLAVVVRSAEGCSLRKKTDHTTSEFKRNGDEWNARMALHPSEEGVTIDLSMTTLSDINKKDHPIIIGIMFGLGVAVCMLWG